MNERLLQFIWQFQYFNKSELLTVSGEPVYIIQPGQHNPNQGPDFLNAQVQIGETHWAGSIELHLSVADWDRHGHSQDPNYDNVILHVIWEEPGGSHLLKALPTLLLKHRIPGILLDRYEELMNLSAFIPCEQSIHSVNDLIWTSWKTRLVAERFQRRSGSIMNLLTANKMHWEEVCWWLLARNFGYRVNSDSFEAMARSIPFTVLQRNRSQLILLEALMLGQAGLLNSRYREAYPRMLQKEYRYQCSKYSLKPILMPVHFLRMRPGNFPTIRIAQLAMLMHSAVHFFTALLESNELETIKKTLDIIANDYWHYHYRFDEESGYKQKRLGAAMIDNIILNTVCTLLYSFGQYHKEFRHTEKAIAWLNETTAESNKTITAFSQIGISCKKAFDSQALLELKTQFCDTRRCLECMVGNSILKQTTEAPVLK
jgi:hypothetical protein